MHPFSLIAFLLSLIGFTREQYEAIRDSKLLHHLAFRSIAILLGCLAFAVAVFAFAMGLLHYALPSALVFAGVSALVLYLMERNNLMDTLSTGRASGKTVAIRIGVIIIMSWAAVALAIFSMRDDIDKRIAERTEQTAKQLQTDPRFAVPLAAAKTVVEQATKDQVRQSELLARISALEADHAKAQQEYINQCEGNTTSDGTRRIVGCGSRARAQASAAASLDAQRQGLQRELDALQERGELAATATSQLNVLNEQINAEAARRNHGAGARLSALYDLSWTDHSVATILGFYLALSLLPEVLVWMALAKPGIYEPTLKRIHEMETMVNNNRLDVLAEAKRDRYTRELPLRHVHVPHIAKPAGPKADANPAGASGPSEGSGSAQGPGDDSSGEDDQRRAA